MIQKERKVAVDGFNSLMAEQRYGEAEMQAAVTQEVKPDAVATRTAELLRSKEAVAHMDTVRSLRHKGYVEAMYVVETYAIPMADQPPILYPNPEVAVAHRNVTGVGPTWQRSPNVLKIQAALDDTTEVDFAERPLIDVIDYFKQRHDIEIQLDNKALREAGVDPASTITRSVKGISLRSALRLLLDEFDLTYVIHNEVLLITSQAKAATMLERRVYPVADLVSSNYWVRRANRRLLNRSLGGTAGGGSF